MTKKLFSLSGTKGFLLPVVVALRRDSHPLLSFRSLLTVIQWYPLLTCLQNHSLPVFQCLNPGSEELRAGLYTNACMKEHTSLRALLCC
jgi:hypothetical protein